MFRVAISVGALGCCAAMGMAGAIECASLETAKLTPSDGSADRFGDVVAIDGDTAMIGAFLDGMADGSVYVYERHADGTWLETVKLTRDDVDRFGEAVSLDGDTAVIGENSYFPTAAAYVYERQADGTWLETTELIPSDELNLPGDDVAIDGDIIVITAETLDWDNNAYMFERQKDGNWIETMKFTNTGVVDVYGSTAMIWQSGASIVYERQPDGTWLEVAEITGAGAGASDIDLSGEIVVIGHANASGGEGNATVHERQADGTWVEVANLTAFDGQTNFSFGKSVSISEGIVVIGANGDNYNGVYTGSAYVYEQQMDGTWLFTAKLTASDGLSQHHFGHAVAIDGGTAMIGAFGDESAYVYEKNASGIWHPVESVDCNANWICDFDEIAAAPWDDADENGILDECEVGACCISTAVICTIAQEADCLQFGGQWQGLGTTCDDSPCPTSCLGDVTGDGEVSVNDLLTVIANWGPCP